MTNDQAQKALTFIKEVKTLSLQPDDMIVITTKGIYSAQQSKFMHAVLKEFFGDHRKILLLPHDQDITCVRDPLKPSVPLATKEEPT